MEVIEIKFLFKLLSYQNYRTTISKIRLGNSIKASGRNQVCWRLFERGFLEFTEKVVKIKISAEGKTALNNNTAKLTELQLKVLKACSNKTIPPSGTRISRSQGRETLIEELAAKGLIIISTKIHQIWLTPGGREYLASEYTPTGRGNINLSKKMLADYLEFLRGYFSTAQQEEQVTPAAAELPDDNNIDDNEIFQATSEAVAFGTVDLDQQHQTDNYLPIFHLRKHFPSLSREKLDQALYRLQAADKIDLSTLAEVEAYSTEQISAGISQMVGGALFYISRETASYIPV